MQDVNMTLPLDSVVQGRYIVKDLLGKGGFGAVYLVSDQRVKSNVFALKEVVETKKAERNRFTFEGELLRRLDHPSLPKVYRTFDEAKNYRAYILMDYIEGPNLEVLRLQQPDQRFSLADAMHLMAPIVSAVSYLHQQQPPIVHRDIKPSNIIVPLADADTVLVDFGIAKEYDEDGTTTAIRRCSPGYGAPEQYASGTNPRTDIYGLGATFYALLTGRVPTDATYRMVAMGSRQTDPLASISDSAPDVPEHVVEAIKRALMIRSEDRFASVEEFWQALHAQPAESAGLLPAVLVTPMVDGQMDEKQVSEKQVSEKETGEVVPVPLAASNLSTIAVFKAPQQTRRRVVLLPLLVVVLLLVLGLVIWEGSHLFSANHSAGSVAARSSVISRTAGVTATKATPIPPTATALPSPTATASPTAAPTPSPTAVVPTTPPDSGTSSIPQLQANYAGPIVDQFTIPATSGTMQLTGVQQNNGQINGNFVVRGGLIGSNTFNGSIGSNGALQFDVPSPDGLLPLFFQGTVNPDGSLSGTYCSYRGNNQCDQSAGGWGTWNVTP